MDRQVGRARDILPMLGVRGLAAIGASALNRSYGQPSLAHAQVSGLGLRLWRGLSSLPGAAVGARFASFRGRAVISFSAVPEASWRCASADGWAMRSGVLTLALPVCVSTIPRRTINAVIVTTTWAANRWPLLNLRGRWLRRRPLASVSATNECRDDPVHPVR